MFDCTIETPHRTSLSNENMETSYAESTTPQGFLRLPAELRIPIYHHLLVRNRESADEPRYPSFLRASKQIYDEAKREMQKYDEVQFVIRGHGLETKAPVTLTIGSTVCFNNTVDLFDKDSVMPAFKILPTLPSGLDSIRRIRLRVEVSRSANDLCDRMMLQVQHLLAALASAINSTAPLEVDIDSSFLKSEGWTSLDIDVLLRCFGKLRPLTPNPGHGSSHILPGMPLKYNCYKEFTVLGREAADLLDLLKRSGVRPNGIPFLERAVEEVFRTLASAEKGLLVDLGGYNVPTKVDVVRNMMKLPQVQKLKAKAEAIVAERAMVE